MIAGIRTNRLRLNSTRMVGAVVVVCGVLMLYWQVRRTATWMDELSPAERQALFLRTEQAIHDVCQNPRSDEQRAYCREQSELILRFNECDASCQARARKHLPRPTK